MSPKKKTIKNRTARNKIRPANAYSHATSEWQLLSYAREIELAWRNDVSLLGAVRTPLASEAEFGVEITESVYAAMMQILFEDSGLRGIQRDVINNRRVVNHCWNAGIEPEIAVQFILETTLT